MSPEVQLIFKFFLGVIVFACLLFMVYVTTRYIGQKASVAMRSGNMKVIETLSLGFDKSIYLVQVGEKYIMIASAGKSIEFLTEVDIEHIEETLTEKPPQIDFYNIFLKYVKKMTASEKVVSIDNQQKNRSNDSIVRNVSILKKSFNRLSGNNKGEDENLNG